MASKQVYVFEEDDKSVWWMFVLAGLVSVVFGFVAVIWPHLTVGVLALLLAVFIGINGVVDLSRSMRKMVHSALEVWRTKSHNSKAQPCSNSKGDVDSNVDRVLLKDAMENVLMSGGKLLKSENYNLKSDIYTTFFL